jgi:hypothetical protein
MPDYRRLLAGLLLTGAAGGGVVRLVQAAHEPNCLFSTALTLDAHPLSRLPARAPRPIAFFGSSAMAGTLLFPHLTLTEHFDSHLRGERSYNVAAPGLNVLGILAYFRLALADRPRLAVVGLFPDDFVFSPSFSSVVVQRPALVRDVLPPEVFAKVSAFCTPRSRALERLRQPSFPVVTAVELAVLHALYAARQRFYRAPRFLPGFGAVDAFGTVDPYFQPGLERPIEFFDDVSALLDAFKRLAAENDVALVVLLPPMSAPIRRKHPEFGTKLTDALVREHIRYLDYSDFLIMDPGAFIDDAHYSPEGNQRLADRLYDDLSAMPGIPVAP